MLADPVTLSKYIYYSCIIYYVPNNAYQTCKKIILCKERALLHLYNNGQIICDKVCYFRSIVCFYNTRQSMFVKHVPPLWAYFIEATK